MPSYIATVSGRVIRAIRKNLLPGIILQVFALMIVLGYYYVPSVKDFFDIIGDCKDANGYLYSALSTCLFGGVIPFIVLLITGQVKKGLYLKLCLFYLFFWFWKGIEVDFFYRLQAGWFGEQVIPTTIVKKVFVDQFLYNPLYAAPCIAIFYLWKDMDFSLSLCVKNLNRDFFLYTIPTLLASTWLVWIPTTAIVYSFPSSLQIPLFNLALCFFVLVIAFLNPAPANNTKTHECIS